MTTVKTAVIPAGGFGTRFLPTSKSIPKEMLPLGSKPVILHVVEEVVKSGIENIIFVVSYNKQSIESFFSSNEGMEQYFISIGKKEQVKNLRQIENMANFSFVYTKPPFGNGGSILAAEHLVKDEPFVLVWADEIIIAKGKPRIKQCLETFKKYGQPVISAIKIADPAERSHYGMAKLKDLPGAAGVKEILEIVEKPAAGKEPSEFAAHGAYVLTPEIFVAGRKVKPRRDNELWLVDLINEMKKKTGLLAKIISDGWYLDCGNPAYYLFSQFDYALADKEYRDEVIKFLSKKQGICKIQ